jgi:DNA segregation ATPase FtsK/SpoIIIE-like protein
VVGVLKRALSEMERRYRLFARQGVRNLDAYRRLSAQQPDLENLPNIILIIDELADLMMAAPDEVEHLICRLAQMARATGIHLVIATQRPSVDVITGLIKANIPTRISFMVSSLVDSRTILYMGGAERLLGRGDMLYLPVDAGKPERIQCTFLADEELERIVTHWHHAPQMPLAPGHSWEPQDEDSQDAQAEAPPPPPADDLLAQAEQIVRAAGTASISLLQRRLSIGYSRAARLIDLLEAQGIISQQNPVFPPSLPEMLSSNVAGAGGQGRSSDRMNAGRSHGQSQPGSLPGSVTPITPSDRALPPA